jgi:hypothetical protein
MTLADRAGLVTEANSGIGHALVEEALISHAKRVSLDLNRKADILQ